MTATVTADAIVIGLGAVGSAALYRLARRGLRAVGLDRFHPPHDRGSTHGESRITRLAVGEGEAYAPLVRRSHEIWRELEAETGQPLFLQTGGLIMGPSHGTPLHHGRSDFVRSTIAIARQYGIPHEALDSAEIGRRYPQFGLKGDEIACYEPSAGLVFPERCVEVQLRLAQAAGATVRTGEAVQSIRPLGPAGHGVEVVTDRGRLQAARVILAAGPWLPGLAGDRMTGLAQVYRQTLHWFAVDDPAAYAPDRFPIFIWMYGEDQEDYLYGFPVLPGSTAIKVASEQYSVAVAPDAVDREVSAGESAALYARHVAGRLHGVTSRCVRAASCLYTVTPDAGFIVDSLQDSGDVLMASACSGHGFKHSAALGEALAAQVAGDAGKTLVPFGLSRYPASELGTAVPV